ncbi:hypothetical protein MJO28_014244 [Puccinia striiformis f. sp. tritici]|uniref:Uncharacterized protein n=1 Tax=Puccinia striiformis f. sp. tritici TaxID=168172 RepID=A0ACC0DTC7_9BASI|nr:hypothetical protein MJO28_014244 [Puccinia striiformis f. sp. tritici]KAI7939371.1 hypothetical protein MJO29_014107 [Puccinia striiformis f. sp. tritici]
MKKLSIFRQTSSPVVYVPRDRVKPTCGTRSSTVGELDRLVMRMRRHHDTFDSCFAGRRYCSRVPAGSASCQDQSSFSKTALTNPIDASPTETALAPEKRQLICFFFDLVSRCPSTGLHRTRSKLALPSSLKGLRYRSKHDQAVNLTIHTMFAGSRMLPIASHRRKLDPCIHYRRAKMHWIHRSSHACTHAGKAINNALS